jgi:hypothetical protein
VSQKILSLYTRITKDGKLWQITFAYGSKHNIKVTARDLHGRVTLSAPCHSKEILDLFPIEYWPAFAVPLANPSESSNGQERLF